MTELMVSALRAAVRGKGYAWFDKGDYNVNLVGIRRSKKDSKAYDHSFTCSYKVRGVWRFHHWACTTDPGEKYLTSPINAEGAAILVPGQYRGAYQIGKHFSKYALVQRGKVSVFRDNNRDSVVDYGPHKEAGWFGINIHKSSVSLSESASAASAGCQVFASWSEHDALLDICREARRRWGDKFTYTLIGERDLTTAILGS